MFWEDQLEKDFQILTLTILPLFHALKFLFLPLVLLLVLVLSVGCRAAGHDHAVGQLLHRLPLRPPRRGVLQRCKDTESFTTEMSGGIRFAGRFKIDELPWLLMWQQWSKWLSRQIIQAPSNLPLVFPSRDGLLLKAKIYTLFCSIWIGRGNQEFRESKSGNTQDRATHPHSTDRCKARCAHIYC